MVRLENQAWAEAFLKLLSNFHGSGQITERDSDWNVLTAICILASWSHCFPSLGLYTSSSWLAANCLLRWKLTDKTGNDINCQQPLTSTTKSGGWSNNSNSKKSKAGDESTLQCKILTDCYPMLYGKIRNQGILRLQCSHWKMCSLSIGKCQHSSFSSFVILLTPHMTISYWADVSSGQWLSHASDRSKC